MRGSTAPAWAAAALIFCLAGSACGGSASATATASASVTATTSAPAPADVIRGKRSSSSEQWLNILKDYARQARDAVGGAQLRGLGAALQPVTIDLPLGGGSGGRGLSLPVLVVPVPIPVDSARQCDASSNAHTDRGTGAGRVPARDRGYGAGRPQLDDYDDFGTEAPRRPFGPTVTPPMLRKDRLEAIGGRFSFASTPSSQRQRPTPAPFPRDRAGVRPRPAADAFPRDPVETYPRPNEGSSPPGRVEIEVLPPRRPTSASYPDLSDERPRPFTPTGAVPRGDAPGVVTSQQLVEQFRAQAPLAPFFPPALVGDHPAPTARRGQMRFGDGLGAGLDSAELGYLPPNPHGNEAAPPRPRFTRSMTLRGKLTVPHADYTELYTARWDAATGAARVDFHKDGTRTLRMTTADGRMQRAVVRTDRLTNRDVVRCGVARARSSAPADRAPPALPDLELFSFAGYAEESGERVELWRHEVAGGDGEAGAARGERLTYRHAVLLRRDRRDSAAAAPVRYTVTVDSSVLGANCEAYEHRYEEVREQDHDPTVFFMDLERDCDEREQLDERDGGHMARLEPLREFTLPTRDPRYDEGIERFIADFDRNYMDDKELAVRKTLYVQHSRFVSSCNRLDSTFEVEVNFLADRLDVEIEVLLGVQYDGESDDDALEFPFAQSRGRSFSEPLPREFDWRPRGAVSEVEYQGSCSSCWAFAVAGSVEGALFVRTRRLVPLSKQCLVDCAHSHGAHGCKGTWPKHAYNYIKDKGIPAKNEYTPYQEKVLPCRERSVPPVTHISGYVSVPPNDTTALKVAIKDFAPNVVLVDSRCKSFIFYKKGVLVDQRCIKGPKEKLNHAVLAVGWGELRDKVYFILKNTYSAMWGEGGYIRVSGSTNTAGVLTYPTFAQLERQDVDRLPAGAGGRGRQDYDAADRGLF